MKKLVLAFMMGAVAMAANALSLIHISTQNCCFSYVYFSMQRVYYLVFVYENEQFCAR